MKKIFIALLGLFFISLFAQHKHEVVAKETLYGIAKKYAVSLDELIKYNPKTKDGKLNIGDVLIIPTKNKQKKEEGKTSVMKNNGTYKVQPKDTFYGISKKFNISQKELFNLNPGLKERGLHPDDIIRVNENAVLKVQEKITEKRAEKPIQRETPPPADKIADEEYLTHFVEAGDTAFGIINKYNISYEQLENLNDGLPNGIRVGDKLKIKKYEKQYKKSNSDVLNIALMLPFGFDSNDSKYRSLATDFLIGAKLAAERNVAQGKKINLNVIDAENENSFKNNISQINKQNTNVIVGPFFKSNVLEVLNYVKEEKIPVVAPFANTSDLYDYANLILVETGNRVYTERIVKEVKQAYANQKIYIVGNDEEAEFIKNQLKKDLSKANVVMLNSSAEVELEQNMMTGRKAPAIVILANNEDRAGKEFAQKLMELGKQAEGIKAFSMYYHSDFERNVDALSKTNLVYLMDRKINVNGNFEKEVLADFNAKYCKAPSKYMIIGFDVVNDVIARAYKNDMIKQMDKSHTHLATKFEYVRTKRNGAFANTGYRVVRLMP
ncbi:MAG: LysM peptidoglycan-binding domain-containing protein [Flavobacteriaceae bacterium]|nr:LysM peptidoglycan-binding domain-containing protein [Flavobacteriaceae bacterium]